MAIILNYLVVEHLYPYMKEKTNLGSGQLEGLNRDIMKWI